MNCKLNQSPNVELALQRFLMVKKLYQTTTGNQNVGYELS